MLTSTARASVALGLVVVLLAATVKPAYADETSEAREHYQKGTSFYDLGRYPEAIREFEAAYQIKNDPALLYNLAQSHRLAGNEEQALHFYRTYLRRVPKAPNRTEIEGRITQLEQLVSQNKAAQTAPPNVTMPPAEAPPTTAPPPSAPPPSAPPTTQPPVMTAPPMDTAQPAPVVMAPPPSENLERAQSTKKWGKITMIAGGGLFLLGAIVGAQALSAANEVNDTAKNGGIFDPAVEERGKNYAVAGNTLMVLGLLAGAGGAGLYFYGRNQEKKAVSVTPMASATGMGGMLRVAF
jgi:tetratricopeptide (TPR) repeat protein